MAITSWQLIAATCCILLETSSALSKTFTGPARQQTATQASSDNSIGGPDYPALYSSVSAPDFERSAPYSSLVSQGSATDIGTPLLNADTLEMGNFAATHFEQQHPKVYQSSVGRVVGPARQASSLQASTATVDDLSMAAGHHHGHHHHGKYYEYREVPKPKTWKFGYKRGNHKHHIERHEHGKAGKHPHFKTKVKWSDKKSKGKGIHLWDYNHHDKKHYHHGK